MLKKISITHAKCKNYEFVFNKPVQIFSELFAVSQGFGIYVLKTCTMPKFVMRFNIYPANTKIFSYNLLLRFSDSIQPPFVMQDTCMHNIGNWFTRFNVCLTLSWSTFYLVKFFDLDSMLLYFFVLDFWHLWNLT